jgi:hypothetical protein
MVELHRVILKYHRHCFASQDALARVSTVGDLIDRRRTLLVARHRDRPLWLADTSSRKPMMSLTFSNAARTPHTEMGRRVALVRLFIS